MSTNMRSSLLMTATVVVGVLLAGTRPAAQGGITFSATASVKSPTKSGSLPVVIKIDQFTSDTDRDALLTVIKGRKPGATLKALSARKDIGFIQLGEQKTPIKFAYARPTGDGRLITIVTAQPVRYLGGSEPGAKPKAGFDLALALLVLDARDSGEGELTPAARVKMDDAGAIVTEDYGSEVVRLVKVVKVS